MTENANESQANAQTGDKADPAAAENAGNSENSGSENAAATQDQTQDHAEDQSQESQQNPARSMRPLPPFPAADPDALGFAAMASSAPLKGDFSAATEMIRVGAGEEQVHGAICYLEKVAEFTPWTWDDRVVEFLHKMGQCETVQKWVLEWLSGPPEKTPAVEAEEKAAVEEAGLDLDKVFEFVPILGNVIRLFR